MCFCLTYVDAIYVKNLCFLHFVIVGFNNTISSKLWKLHRLYSSLLSVLFVAFKFVLHVENLVIIMNNKWSMI